MQRSIQLLKMVVLMVVFSGLIFTGLKVKRKIDSRIVSVNSDIYGATNMQLDKNIKISTSDLHAKNGKNGNDCWIVYRGNVYSTNHKERWKDGQYISSSEELKCGQNLTNALDKSPFKSEILSSATKIGNF